MVSFPYCFETNDGTCPWEGENKAKALFEKHPSPPWPKPIDGNTDIAGFGILVAFAVTALLFSVLQLSLRVMLLWIPKTNLDWDRFNDRSAVRGLRAALLGLEDTLLITGYAYYAAVALDQCHLSIYHLKLLSWLFTASYSTGIAIVWASRDALLYTLPFIKRPPHWGPPPYQQPQHHQHQHPQSGVSGGSGGGSGGGDGTQGRWRWWRATAAVWGRAAALAGLCGTSLVCLVWLARTRIPNFPMPAMSAPAFCFFGHKYPHEYNAFLDNYPFPLLVAMLATAAPGVSWVLAHALALGGGGAWARRRHAKKEEARRRAKVGARGAGGGSTSDVPYGGGGGYALGMAEEQHQGVKEGGDGDGGDDDDDDDAAGRLVRRLKTIEGIIYASCNAVAVRYAFHVWHKAQPFLKPGTSERDWGFGQVVAVILVLAPVLAFLETVTNFDDHRKKGETLSLPLRHVKVP